MIHPIFLRHACLGAAMPDGRSPSCSQRLGWQVAAMHESSIARHEAVVTPEPGSWQHDLVELLETLKQHEVPFLVVGGYAVAHAGHLRATKDLDVFVPRAAGVDARLTQALSEFLGATVPVEEARSKFLRFFIGRPGAIDVIRELPGVTWRTAWKGRSVGLFFGVRVPFLGVDSLIRNKRAVGRHQDLADVEELVRIRRERRS